jgi:hypothetical protein
MEPDSSSVTWPPDHKTFNKIPRLGRTLTITEKLDGTNALVAIHPDPAQPIAIGSRNRWITPGKQTDNYGFAEWVLANEGAIRRLGPGWHYGEWWGAGIARRYALAERRWSLFDTRWTEEELRTRGLPANVHVVPTMATRELQLRRGAEDPVMAAIERLEAEGSIAAPGFMQPEGIVVRFNVTGQLYKFTFDGDGREPTKPKARAPQGHDVVPA